jgi:hypothetical protein
MYSFSIYRGDDYSLVFTIEGNRTSSTPTLTLKTTLETATVTLAITSPAITQVYDAPNDWTLVTVPFSAAQSAALTSGVYFYDFAYLTGALKATWLAGTIALTKDVGT